MVRLKVRYTRKGRRGATLGFAQTLGKTSSTLAKGTYTRKRRKSRNRSLKGPTPF
jgi:hypothetical protein